MPPLSSICEVRSGLPVKARVGDGVRVVRLGDVDWDTGAVAWDGLAASSDVDPTPHHLLRAGDVLFAAKGQTNRPVLVTEDHDAVAASAFFVVRPTDAGALPAYVAWYLDTAPAQAHVQGCARGTRIRSVTKSCLGSVDVPLPPPEVQDRIASVAQLAAEERALMEDLAGRKARLVEALALSTLSSTTS